VAPRGGEEEEERRRGGEDVETTFTGGGYLHGRVAMFPDYPGHCRTSTPLQPEHNQAYGEHTATDAGRPRWLHAHSGHGRGQPAAGRAPGVELLQQLVDQGKTAQVRWVESPRVPRVPWVRGKEGGGSDIWSRHAASCTMPPRIMHPPCTHHAPTVQEEQKVQGKAVLLRAWESVCVRVPGAPQLAPCSMLPNWLPAAQCCTAMGCTEDMPAHASHRKSW
jgi:hypothetical protein